jgi:predicted acetyltransferase
MSRGPDVVVRAVEEHEVPTMVRTDSAGFGEDGTKWLEQAGRWLRTDLERTACAFEGDEMVGTSRNFSLEVTVPGAAIVPAAGVSAVAVLPTHRRRGVLTEMMQRLLDDAVERGEPIAILTASEGGIYGRFGFGVTSRAAAVSIDTRDVEFARPRPGGRLRLVDPDEARKPQIEVFERLRATDPGVVSRPESWWSDIQYEKELGTRFDVLYESASGSLDGYVLYGMKDLWDPEPVHTLRVIDLVATTPEAEHALWRYLAEIDLVRTVKAMHVAPDSPLPWLLRSPRAAWPRSIHDWVWHRVLDVPAALGARTYAASGVLALEVHDPFRPGSAADGTFALDGGPDGATCAPVQASADLVCDVSTLSAVWLGGVRWSELARAGLVEERSDGALARADAMFASTPLPFAYTWF